jgi:hypothetical protein
MFEFEMVLSIDILQSPEFDVTLEGGSHFTPQAVPTATLGISVWMAGVERLLPDGLWLWSE